MERVLLLPAPLAAGLLAGFALYPSAARAEPNGSAGGAKSAPRVVAAQKHDLSPPLRRIPPIPPHERTPELSPNPGLPGRGRARPLAATPPLDARVAATRARPRSLDLPALTPSPMPAPLVNFPGIGSSGGVPPDTNGAVGPHHYVQWINSSLAIWDRAGNLVYGPAAGNTLWTGFGGICEGKNGGDGIVLYDHLAGRWLLSQLAFDWPHNFHQCIAVSQTGDPTGAWYRYDYFWDNDVLNDYPKFAVWPDAYYMAVNQYLASTQDWRGQAAAALDREKMLHGEDAPMVRFDLFAVNPNYGGQLPADLDGPLPPPAGSPAYFVEVDDDAWGWPSDRMQLWKLHVDWSNPSLSTFGAGGNPDAVIDLTAAGYGFDSDLCEYRCCIPEPGGNRVDALSDRTMWRLAYRNFGTHESLTVNHTVDADGTDHAGVRWYEVRDPAGAPLVAQGGTHAPDSDHRWMGSLAMDGAGDIALGYSVSGAATYPSIRYAGRLAADPPGTLLRTEATLAAGGGSQTGACRWGDYSSMTVDPTDDCTFWYTQEYYATTGPYPWQTRIGAFRFDGCRSCPLVGIPSLSIHREPPGIRLDWTAATNAAASRLVEGSLAVLRGTGGDFAQAISRCLAQAITESSLHVDEPDPHAGDGFFYLVDGEKNGCLGSFDEPGTGQIGSRDAGIRASAHACP